MPNDQYVVVRLDDGTIIVCQPVLRLTEAQAVELARNLDTVNQPNGKDATTIPTHLGLDRDS
jgi:hypothetical protein